MSTTLYQQQEFTSQLATKNNVKITIENRYVARELNFRGRCAPFKINACVRDFGIPRGSAARHSAANSSMTALYATFHRSALRWAWYFWQSWRLEACEKNTATHLFNYLTPFHLQLFVSFRIFFLTKHWTVLVACHKLSSFHSSTPTKRRQVVSAAS